MAVSERGFDNFYLGDNVYELSEGLIPEIADALRIDIGTEPNSEGLQRLMDEVGTKKELRLNPELELDLERMADFVESAGVQLPLSRSLWSPDVPADCEHVDKIVIQGGVANWQNRTFDLLSHSFVAPILAIGGNRVMKTPTEIDNPDVVQHREVFGKYPTEFQYMASVVVPTLVNDGRSTLLAGYPSRNASELFRMFLHENPEVVEQNLAVARVANAGIVMALQLRAAAREINPEFDADPENPQLYVMTDELDVARTEEEVRNPKLFQHPATALRQVVLTAKKLHEAEL